MKFAVGPTSLLEMRSFACSFSLAAWCLAVPVAAQSSAAEPDPLQLRAAQQVLREERELQRLTLSDAWMKHLDREERDQLTLQRWVGGAMLGLSAVGWGIAAAANEAQGGARGHTLALGATAAVSLGLFATQIFLSDDYDARQVSAWGLAFQFAALGASAFVLAGGDSCDQDCPLTLTLVGASSITFAVAMALVELLSPAFYVSQHYARYLAKPAAERPAYALDLMLMQESRRRTAGYLHYAMATVQASFFAVGAMQAEQGTTQGLLAGLSAITFVTASVNLIVQLVERTPTEKLAMGLPPPPAPEAF